MPTKITNDPETGTQIEVEMEGEELAAHEALLASMAQAEANTPPSRDERLLGAVELAKEIVGSGGFTETQAAKLAAIFDGLGQAITGGR